VGVVLLFAFFGLLVLIVAGASPRGNKYEKTRAKAREEKLKTARDEAMPAMTTYGWVDKAKGVAHIPIEAAMKLTVAELARKQPAPAGPIATPAPPASAPATASPAPSPAAATSPAKPSSVVGPNSENRGQPAAADNPASAPPGTQPGASATPAATPSTGAAQPHPGGSVAPTPSPPAPGSPLPVRGKTP